MVGGAAAETAFMNILRPDWNAKWPDIPDPIGNVFLPLVNYLEGCFNRVNDKRVRVNAGPTSVESAQVYTAADFVPGAERKRQ